MSSSCNSIIFLCEGVDLDALLWQRSEHKFSVFVVGTHYKHYKIAFSHFPERYNKMNLFFHGLVRVRNQFSFQAAFSLLPVLSLFGVLKAFCLFSQVPVLLLEESSFPIQHRIESTQLQWYRDLQTGFIKLKQ